MSKHKRKASVLQIIAAQKNGAKSQGPATPEGRATSARNATRHSNCSKALVLTMEDEASFAEHQKNYFDEFQPVGEIEFGLVTDMVAAKWRQWRLWTLETALYDVQMDKQMKMIDETFKSIDETTRCAIAFQTLADESKALSLLLRYETSMRRMHERCLKTLMDLQKLRKAAEAQSQGSELTPEESTTCEPTPTPMQKLRNEPGDHETAAENSPPESAECESPTAECEFPRKDEAA
jgi:hypothetical protein